MNHMIDGHKTDTPEGAGRPLYESKCALCDEDSESRICDYCLFNHREWWDRFNNELYEQIVFEKKISNLHLQI